MTRNLPALLEEPPVDIDDPAREPEQMQAYHDMTLGGHDLHLAYLRNRPIGARELLSDNGSIFVQVLDKNSYRVRIVVNEV
jgi:adenine-specific DNA-methyltransferase